MTAQKVLIKIAILACLGQACIGAMTTCAPVAYHVSGRLLERGSGLPISRARVVLFFDDYETMETNEGRLSYETTDSGDFTAVPLFWKRQWLDLFFGCTIGPSRLTLLIQKEGYKPVRIDMENLETKGPKKGNYLNLGDVKITLKK